MYNRIVDRAAPHTPPALLTVRDWLLVALAFASGMYEAISFLSFGKVFTAFQTGNIVFLGLAAVGTRPPAGPNPVSVVVSLAAFAIGAMIAIPLLKLLDGDEEVEDKDVVHVWPRRVSVALGVALAAQLCFLVIWVAASPSTDVTYVLLGLGAFALGLQMNAVRSLHVPAISTTAATATYISLVSGLATWSLTRVAVRRMLGVLVAMALGALLATWMLGHAHTFVPVVPALVLAIVIVIASVALKERPAPQPEPLVMAGGKWEAN